MIHKYKYIFAISLIFTFTSFAQNEILNSGFENWSNGKPNHWLSTNIPNNIATNVSQTSDANTGSFAITGEVQTVFDADYSPGIFTGYNESVVETGFPVTQKFASFTGYYKFIRGGNILDEFHIVATLTNQSGSGRIAEAEMDLPPAADYTFFEIPFVYDPENLNLDPEVIHVSIAIDETPDGEINLGSNFFIDDLGVNGTTDIELSGNNIPSDYLLKQNYPNPFNPSTAIDFSIPDPGFATLQVYNMLGEKVATLFNKFLSAGSYSALWDFSNLPSNTYIYRLTINNFSSSKKMILMK
jgi:hypothetical protein